MNDSLFPSLATKSIRTPRTTTDGETRPAWSNYKTVKPVQCDHCVIVAYESVMAHEGYDGIRSARFKRTRDGNAQLLCSEHAQMQRDADKVKWPRAGAQHDRGQLAVRQLR